MTPEYQLDTVLRSLDHDLEVRELFEKVEQRLKGINFDIGVKNLDLLLDKLAIDGHIEKEHVISGGVKVNRFTYNISFQGRLFLSRGGYKDQTKTIIWNNRFKIAKTSMNIANAIIILFIGGFGVWVAYDSKQKDADIKSLTVQLDKQAATIDSLRHTSTATKDNTLKNQKP